MSQNERPVILLGGGGHARVLLDLLRLLNRKVSGIADPQLKAGSLLYGIKVIGGDEAVRLYDPASVYLVNGVGTVKVSSVRKDLFSRFKALRFDFLTLRHPDSCVAGDAELNEGAQVMAGAVIQTGAVVGQNTLINTRTSVDHDCKIGAHVHVAPGAVLCGGVEVGEGSFIGAGAVVIQSSRIAPETFIRAGQIVAAPWPDSGRES